MSNERRHTPERGAHTRRARKRRADIAADAGGNGVEVRDVGTSGIDNQTQAAELAEIRSQLLAWWDVNARDLPWRFGRTTPWGVLVSEVMSQQTQMSRVVPYWQSWIAVWPDARALSKASPAEVITAWGKLGYPRRALRLQACARVVSEQYQDELPKTYMELTNLPGVGDYTASAVMSFAYGERIAVLDTNIRRVLSRIFLGTQSQGGSSSLEERSLAAAMLPDDVHQSVLWNQALMELGALTCTARKPLCESCPLAQYCAFNAAGKPGLGLRPTRPRQHFKGTDRQVRGIILDALRNASAHARVSREELDGLWSVSGQLDACLASLDDDGLIMIHPDSSISFPD
jgi:A/G-specific adenine glycosylase